MSIDLFHAVIRGSVEGVEQALRAGGDVNSALQANWLFAWTIRRGAAQESPFTTRQMQARERDVLAQMLHGGPDRSSQTLRTRTPLLLATEFGDVEMTELLLAHGAEVDTKDEDGWTPVLFAVRRGDGDLLRSVLQAGADPNPQLTGGLSALFLAARAGFAEGVRRLLEAGANANGSNVNGITPLMAAASFGHAFVSGGPFYPGERYLIEDVVARMEGSRVRTKPQHLACLEMLLDAGANPNAVGYGNPINEGDTALKFGALTGVFTSVHLLLNAGAEINFSGGILATAFICAVCSGKEPTVAYLKERGADIHETGADGLSALMCAARSGYTHLVHYLLDNGATVNGRRDDGETALFFAVNGGNVETARALIERGAKVDAPDSRGRTPLMLAAHQADPDMVQLLLNEGADVHARSEDGKTALVWARSDSWEEDDDTTNLSNLEDALTGDEALEMMRQMLGDITGEEEDVEEADPDDNRLRVQRLLRFAGGTL